MTRQGQVRAVRAYLILTLREEMRDKARSILGSYPGVVSAEMADKTSEMVLITTGETQDDLMTRTMDVIIAAEDYVDRIECLPVVLPDMPDLNGALSDAADI